MILGLTGGSGSGKSTAARIFAEEGAFVIDADMIAREVEEKGSPALAEIVDCFGPEMLNADGTLNRRKLGSVVFSDKLKLLMLNKITHKYITRKIMNIISVEEVKHPLIVIDAALLFESGMDKVCDFTVAVTAPEELRVKRICARDGISPEDAIKRIRSQTPQDALAGRAGYVLENCRGIEELRENVIMLARALMKGGI